MNVKAFGGILRDAAAEWLQDKAPRLGAALAYYTVFSLAPLLVIVIAVCGLIFGREAAQTHLVTQMEGLVGPAGAEAVRSMLDHAGRPAAGIMGTVLGIAMLVFGATGLFGELQDALNTIWKVPPKPSRGIWGIIQTRFLSFSMVLGVAFLLLVSLVVSAGVAAFVQIFGEWNVAFVGHALNEVISLIVVTLLFAMIFRFLPDVRIAWRNVWLGAALTAVLFEAGKFALGLYLGHSGVASAYGAAGSLAVLLVWLYYSAQIFLFGAEFTEVYARHGTRGASAERAARGPHRDIGYAPAGKELQAVDRS